MKRTMLAVAALLIVACGSSPKKNTGETTEEGTGRKIEYAENPTRGTATLLVDETFCPMIEGVVMIFENQYKYASLDVQACPEQEIVARLRGDSSRLALLSRPLTDGEKAWYESRQLYPRVTPVAFDGIALVVSRQSEDSEITTATLRAMLRGENTTRTLVFDNPASGTVRFMKEVAGTDSLKGIYSLRSNRDILEYVASNPNAIGFTGVDWLYEADSTQQQYLHRIKVLAVDGYKPTQNDIAEGKYPFTRQLYLINSQGTAGLGMGFASFIAGDLGQRIVLKSGLVPVKYPKREIVLRNKL